MKPFVSVVKGVGPEKLRNRWVTQLHNTHIHIIKTGIKKQNVILEPKEFTISIVRPNWQINPLSEIIKNTKWVGSSIYGQIGKYFHTCISNMNFDDTI